MSLCESPASVEQSLAALLEYSKKILSWVHFSQAGRFISLKTTENMISEYWFMV
jgi:hypothetical protein